MSLGSALRDNFPLLAKSAAHGYALVYLDNAATTPKPHAVIDVLVAFYTFHAANVHRGIYALAEETTALYEKARADVAAFMGADAHEIVFTRGATEGINAVAASLARAHVRRGDQIVVTALEHHSNFVPWQECARRCGAEFFVVGVNNDGTVAMDDFCAVLSPKTKLVAVTHVSNALGTRVDVARIIEAAHEVGAKVLVDAAQSVGHEDVNVRTLGCDFLVFSGHKVFGPLGIGVLFIERSLHECMEPAFYGGGMLESVGRHDATWLKAPHKFEAGTPPVADAVGLAAALAYVRANVDFVALRAHEARLCARLIEGLCDTKKIVVHGPVEQLKNSGHIVSFNVAGVHPHDVAAHCDTFGICVRAGFHCAQPLAAALGVGPSVRVSTHAFTTSEDIDTLLVSLEKIFD